MPSMYSCSSMTQGYRMGCAALQGFPIEVSPGCTHRGTLDTRDILLQWGEQLQNAYLLGHTLNSSLKGEECFFYAPHTVGSGSFRCA